MSGAAATSAGAQAEEHEQDTENREAYQYWGYLFKPDKTGTDKLKGLLRGLKELINQKYEPSDNPDLTPTQLAHFYRELHGNYDQLFLGTPSESIAFIYKSLGCVHSLQPLPHSTAFTDPTVPALKTEGWTMWQTIQLLLAPEEHSSFLMEAVQKWDVKDPTTGEVFPKILPRQSFPLDPDKHMVAWYEGVSERLRREAEDEERQRDMEAQQAEVRRIRGRKEDTDDEGSVDSKGPALAYFRNPLYRHVDGRPTIVRGSSKRPTLDPKPTFKNKGKEAANTMGHVIRNIGSPNLWDPRSSRPSESRNRDHHKRRSSLPDNRHGRTGDPPPPSSGHSSKLSPSHDRHGRRRSAQLEPPPRSSSQDTWEYDDDEASGPSPGPSPHHHDHGDDPDSTLRHSRSHEPTPSQKEYPDYFHGFDNPSSRRSSAYEGSGAPPTPNGIGPAFGPSASPLFASHIAKQPQPQPPPPPRMPFPEHFGPPKQSPSMRRAQGEHYSRSPDSSSRSRDDRERRHHGSHDRRSRHGQSPAPDYDGASQQGSGQPGFPPLEDPSRAGSGSPVTLPGGYAPPSSIPHRSDRRSGSARVSESEISGVSGAEDRDRDRDRDRRDGRPKKTRFAAGVDGRRYPSESPWR